MTAPHYQHRQSAHCETGAVANILRGAGLDLSEPMVFGLASGLVFAYLPVIKLAGQPLVAYRTPPGAIRTALSARIKVKWREQTFTDQGAAMRALEAAISQRKVVGLQTGIYWLPYIPKDMRFHFNAHNIVVTGKDDGGYLVSDPVLTEIQRCSSPDLQAARFARGPLAPQGRMYVLERIPSEIDYQRIGPAAIRMTARLMLAPVVPIAGVNGVRLLGRFIAKEITRNEENAKLLLAHVVRMQEEIGTGGAGFRFLYAAFLNELSKKLARPDLATASVALTDAGDEWRRFALVATKMCRGREAISAAKLTQILDGVASREEQLWRSLAKG